MPNWWNLMFLTVVPKKVPPPDLKVPPPQNFGLKKCPPPSVPPQIITPCVTGYVGRRHFRYVPRPSVYFFRGDGGGGESAPPPFPPTNSMDFWPAAGGMFFLGIFEKTLNVMAPQWNFLPEKNTHYCTKTRTSPRFGVFFTKTFPFPAPTKEKR